MPATSQPRSTVTVTASGKGACPLEPPPVEKRRSRQVTVAPEVAARIVARRGGMGPAWGRVAGCGVLDLPGVPGGHGDEASGTSCGAPAAAGRSASDPSPRPWFGLEGRGVGGVALLVPGVAVADTRRFPRSCRLPPPGDTRPGARVCAAVACRSGRARSRCPGPGAGPPPPPCFRRPRTLCGLGPP